MDGEGSTGADDGPHQRRPRARQQFRPAADGPDAIETTATGIRGDPSLRGTAPGLPAAVVIRLAGGGGAAVADTLLPRLLECLQQVAADAAAADDDAAVPDEAGLPPAATELTRHFRRHAGRNLELRLLPRPTLYVGMPARDAGEGGQDEAPDAVAAAAGGAVLLRLVPREEWAHEVALLLVSVHRTGGFADKAAFLSAILRLAKERQLYAGSGHLAVSAAYMRACGAWYYERTVKVVRPAPTHAPMRRYAAPQVGDCIATPDILATRDTAAAFIASLPAMEACRVVVPGGGRSVSRFLLWLAICTDAEFTRRGPPDLDWGVVDAGTYQTTRYICGRASVWRWQLER